MESNSTYYKTPIGFAEIIGDKNGIQSIALLDNSTNEQGLEKFDLPQDIPECLQECVLQLKEYFKGERTKFDLLLIHKAPHSRNWFGKNFVIFLSEKQHLI